ncbi:MAG: hypothetical protein HC806_08430 [Anaerolineae bacterium]|nr:hypothetical protein [Anaerolineae bacterium]
MLEGTEVTRLTGVLEREGNYENAMEVGTGRIPFILANAQAMDVPETEINIQGIQGEMLGAVHTRVTTKGGFLNLSTRQETVSLQIRVAFHIPCLTTVEVSHQGGKVVFVNAHLPVNTEKTITKWAHWRTSHPGKRGDAEVQKQVEQIFNQDSKPSATMQAAYRELQEKYVAMGWAIDTHRIQTEFARQQAVVIPSPARREVAELAKAWVMKEVPVKKVSSE